MDDLSRITKIVVLFARRYGALAAVYSSATSFDVLTERWTTLPDGQKKYDGMSWVRRKTRDAYLSPAATAKSIKAEIRGLWA